jgi:hypothetical protein
MCTGVGRGIGSHDGKHTLFSEITYLHKGYSIGQGSHRGELLCTLEASSDTLKSR